MNIVSCCFLISHGSREMVLCVVLIREAPLLMRLKCVLNERCSFPEHLCIARRAGRPYSRVAVEARGRHRALHFDSGSECKACALQVFVKGGVCQRVVVPTRGALSTGGGCC